MRWWVLILLPFHLLAQETYTNCEDLLPQNYQVSYDVNKEYNWEISGGQLLFVNSNSISVQWPDTVGTYIISVWTTRFGCLGDTSYHEVIIEECPYMQLYFPNSFTPNGDGHNDLYQIGGKSADDIEEITIFNRWGERIFEATGNVPWTGIECQNGVYSMTVLINNQRYIRTITLIR